MVGPGAEGRVRGSRGGGGGVEGGGGGERVRAEEGAGGGSGVCQTLSNPPISSWTEHSQSNSCISSGVLLISNRYKNHCHSP